MNFTYKTIAAPAQSLFKDRGSKFLGYAYPFPQKERLKEILTALKAEHPKAVHHCYAYRLGAAGEDFRANDDGEPSGSAGRPILGQIDSWGLTNVLVVVVRYFGGTLLGVPGLINAYKTATAECLTNAQIIERPVEIFMDLSFDYPKMSEVMHWTKHFQANIIHQDLGLFCQLKVAVPKINFEAYHQKMQSIFGVEVKLADTSKP